MRKSVLSRMLTKKISTPTYTTLLPNKVVRVEWSTLGQHPCNCHAFLYILLSVSSLFFFFFWLYGLSELLAWFQRPFGINFLVYGWVFSEYLSAFYNKWNPGKQILKFLEFYVKLWFFVRTIFIGICYYKFVDFNCFVFIMLLIACIFLFFVFTSLETCKSGCL